MTVEITILISVLSVSFAIYSGLKNIRRSDRKDAAEDAAQEAVVVTKLDALQTSMVELKTEVKGYREEVRTLTAQAVRNEESLKSLHKRVDRMEQVLQLKAPNTE